MHPKQKSPIAGYVLKKRDVCIFPKAWINKLYGIFNTVTDTATFYTNKTRSVWTCIVEPAPNLATIIMMGQWLVYLDDADEVVVEKDDVGGGLGDLRPREHREPDICQLKRREGGSAASASLSLLSPPQVTGGKCGSRGEGGDGRATPTPPPPSPMLSAPSWE